MCQQHAVTWVWRTDLFELGQYCSCNSQSAHASWLYTPKLLRCPPPPRSFITLPTTHFRMFKCCSQLFVSGALNLSSSYTKHQQQIQLNSLHNLLEDPRIFQNHRSHLKILGARRVTWRTFRTEDPQVSGAHLCTPVLLVCLRDEHEHNNTA
jgi:hypothetical protein